MLVPTNVAAEDAATLEGARIFDEEHRVFEKRARSHTGVLLALQRRENSVRRDALRREYLHQIELTEEAANTARRRAVARLEAMAEETPPDSIDAPDAMLRLAALAFDESQERFLAATARWQEIRGETRPENDTDHPRADYSRTLELVSRLIREHPRFPRLDHALFLQAMSHQLMGQPEEACVAWLRLACGNLVPVPSTTSTVPESNGAAWAVVHEAIAESSAERLDDPYASCTPAVPETRYLDEAWLAIGGYHYDSDLSEQGLALSAAAYRRVTTRRASPHRELALYRLAVTYHCARMLQQAVRGFVEVLELNETNGGLPGRAGLRREALRALTICLADIVWDTDPQDALRSARRRLRDSALLPQNRTYTPQITFGVGRVYHDAFRYHDAVDVFESYVERWPLSLETP